MKSENNTEIQENTLQRSIKSEGIIFDLDGTLWSTSDQIVPAWNDVLQRKGLPLITVSQMNSFMGKTPDMIASMMLPDMPHVEAMYVFAECVVEENNYLKTHGGTLYEGLETTLAHLKKNYFLAVVSNCLQDYLNTFLDFHGLRGYFDDCETFGGTRLQKSENIRLVVKRNHLNAAVYVGDTELDRQSAEKAGVPFIWAKYGFGTDVVAQQTINSINELPQVVEKII